MQNYICLICYEGIFLFEKQSLPQNLSEHEIAISFMEKLNEKKNVFFSRISLKHFQNKYREESNFQKNNVWVIPLLASKQSFERFIREPSRQFEQILHEH